MNLPFAVPLELTSKLLFIAKVATTAANLGERVWRIGETPTPFPTLPPTLRKQDGMFTSRDPINVHAK